MALPVRRIFALPVSMLMLALVMSPAGASDEELDADATITVSAASDLIPAFEELGDRFTGETGVDVDLNFGSTGQLTQQILAGAPVDLFAAANVQYIEQLDDAGMIVPETQALYGQGRLVLWTHPDSDLEIERMEDLAASGAERIAIANPSHAPYGVAAREALEHAGIWDELQDRLVLGENISDTLRLAQTGNVDVAIVALSLVVENDVGRWTLIDAEYHEPIDQALAVIAGSDHESEARAFASFVNSDAGREVMSRYGFVLPGEELELPALTATPDA